MPEPRLRFLCADLVHLITDLFEALPGPEARRRFAVKHDRQALALIGLCVSQARFGSGNDGAEFHGLAEQLRVLVRAAITTRKEDAA